MSVLGVFDQFACQEAIRYGIGAAESETVVMVSAVGFVLVTVLKTEFVADSLLVRKQKCCLGEAIAWLEATVLRLRLRLLLVRETGNNNIILNS